MRDHPIETLISSVLENLKKMVDANTVIGEPIITPNGVTIIPVTKLSCGFGCGGGEYSQKVGESNIPFGGGTGGGVSLNPLGFIYITADGNKVDFIPLKEGGSSSAIDSLFESASSLISNIKWPKKKGKAEEDAEDVVEDIVDQVSEKE